MHKHQSFHPHDKHCCCKEHGPAIRGYLIPCLLLLLKDAPSHGYQLIELLEKRGYLREIPDPGVIYRHLRRLEQDGMVTSTFEPGDGPARKVYTLAAEGRAALSEWVRNLVELKGVLEAFLSDASLAQS
jgi:PadR family transcriptional regulator PadR